MNRQNSRPEDATDRAIERGRSELAGWEAAQPDNFFSADANLRRLLVMFWGTDSLKSVAPQFYHFGRAAATAVDRAARVADLASNLPELARFDGIGQRLEAVEFHPSYHEAGRHIYASGMLSVLGDPGHNVLALALFYISSQNGEAGHNCPVACTAGAIKALQAVGSPDLQEAFLPRLLEPDYDTNFHAAQYLTEVQGGSDVGANATEATPLDPERGTWLISGEKWFCSNVTADVILLTARVPAGGDGTRGLGLFLMPRLLEDGSLNRFTINRLKDKLGTRSMASGEVLFEGALAYQVGPVRDGFKNVMTHVINTSRLYNALGCAGNARRAYLVASTYAQHRRAFGQPVVHFPVTQDLLAGMRAATSAILGGSLRLAHVIDRLELGRDEPDDAGFLRLALNLNKMRSAMLAHEVIVTGIELLGGNGAIETFSVLPRLLRDNVVFENWEGTHNVLLAQIGRDMRRYRVHEPFLRRLRTWLAGASAVAELRDQVEAALEAAAGEIDVVLAMDELTAGIYMRPLMTRLADLYYATCLTAEAGWELTEKQDRLKQRLALLFFQRRVLELEPKAIPYYDDLVGRLALER